MSLDCWLALLRKLHISKSTPIEDPRARGRLIAQRLRDVMEITTSVPVDIQLPSTATEADDEVEHKAG